jgi:hypothetical protein
MAGGFPRTREHGNHSVTTPHLSTPRPVAEFRHPPW